MRPAKHNPQVKQALQLVDQISPMLAGKDPQVVGAALAELTGVLIMGHDPRIRLLLLQAHYKTVERILREYPDPWGQEGNGHAGVQ